MNTRQPFRTSTPRAAIATIAASGRVLPSLSKQCALSLGLLALPLLALLLRVPRA